MLFFFTCSVIIIRQAFSKVKVSPPFRAEMLTNLRKGAKLDVKNCDKVHVDFVQDIYPSIYVDSYLF